MRGAPDLRRALVCVVDDDESLREALPDLLGTFGFEARAFASAEDFLASDELHAADCLILDVAMPGMTGPELHQELKRRRHTASVIFVTAQRERGLPARLVDQGAVDCLLKPFSETALLDALNSAFTAR